MAQDKDEHEEEPTGEERQDGEDTPPHVHIEGVDDGCGKK